MYNFCSFLVFSVRLYDVQTSQCFVSDQPNYQHKGPITMVKYYLFV